MRSRTILGDGRKNPIETTPVTIVIHTSATESSRSANVARLIQCAAAGENRSWESLVDRFGAVIWRVARRHGLGDADTADVAQATWLRLLAHLDDLKDPARVGGWLARTARRECLRVLRESRRHVLAGDDLPDRECGEDIPETVLLIAERNVALWGTFARLHPTDQELLQLLIADPRPTYREISAAMAMPIKRIAPTRDRALRRLRYELLRTDFLTLPTA